MKPNFETLKRFKIPMTIEEQETLLKEIVLMRKQIQDVIVEYEDDQYDSYCKRGGVEDVLKEVLGKSVYRRSVHEHCKRCGKEISLIEAKNVNGPGFCYGCWVNHKVDCQRILD